MTCGICKLSLVPVRTEPSDKSELCTQLLFGEMYHVLEQTADRKWLKIQILFDQYIGWISAIQHFTVSESYYNAYTHHSHGICSAQTTLICTDAYQLLLLPGSILPFFKDKTCSIGEEIYDIAGKAMLINTDGIEKNNYWKKVACMYIKSPYLWGGKTPFGIDCSGFTQQVYRICGFSLLRDAYQQATQGTLVENLKTARPGDLVFFSNDKGKIVHVGILFEPDKIIHASGEVRIDQLDAVGIWHTGKQLYTHSLHVIKRIMNY